MVGYVTTAGRAAMYVTGAYTRTLPGCSTMSDGGVAANKPSSSVGVSAAPSNTRSQTPSPMCVPFTDKAGFAAEAVGPFEVARKAVTVPVVRGPTSPAVGHFDCNEQLVDVLKRSVIGRLIAPASQIKFSRGQPRTKRIVGAGISDFPFLRD